MLPHPAGYMRWSLNRSNRHTTTEANAQSTTQAGRSRKAPPVLAHKAGCLSVRTGTGDRSKTQCWAFSGIRKIVQTTIMLKKRAVLIAWGIGILFFTIHRHHSRFTALLLFAASRCRFYCRFWMPPLVAVWQSKITVRYNTADQLQMSKESGSWN